MLSLGCCIAFNHPLDVTSLGGMVWNEHNVVASATDKAMEGILKALNTLAYMVTSAG